MKASLILSILGAAVMVAAQDLSQLPSCALPCASSMTSTGCAANDYACICKNEKFLTDVSTCLKEKCKDDSEIQKAIGVAQTLCGGNLPSGIISSLQGAPTGTGSNTTTGSSNATKTSSGTTQTSGGSGSSSTGGSGSSGSSNSAAGLVPGGFAAAAVLAGLFTL